MISSADFNQILERTRLASEIAQFLMDFPQIRNDITRKKGIYLYGASGVGKTQFILSIIKSVNMDPILYDSGTVRNKSFIQGIASKNMSTNNVLNMLKKQNTQTVIVMDEIDGINRRDNGGISELTKLIRHKKMKKHLNENTSAHPIICIGDYNTDKKLNELTKVCVCYELKPPTYSQMLALTERLFPDAPYKDFIAQYADKDIRKLIQIGNLGIQSDKFMSKLHNDNINEITKTIINTPYTFSDYYNIINDSDRTVVSLLYHENIVDTFTSAEECFPIYLRILDNLCFSDYMYRITFQNQIWQFNEMCCIIKLMYNNLIHSQWKAKHDTCTQLEKVRFTKILTNWNTENGNAVFLKFMSNEMGMDRRDMYAFFQEMKMYFTTGDYEATHDKKGAKESNKGTKGVEFDTPYVIGEMEKIFAFSRNITRVEIRRMYRFLSQTQIPEDIDMTVRAPMEFGSDMDDETESVISVDE